jgi:hypothetical protein
VYFCRLSPGLVVARPHLDLGEPEQGAEQARRFAPGRGDPCRRQDLSASGNLLPAVRHRRILWSADSQGQSAVKGEKLGRFVGIEWHM